ncbi:f3b837d1-9966-45a6-9a97-952ddeb3c61c [Thermothielavioides terrestris]|uniref:F3b837d1-9966-45a6-9a97-952ddeb3c61c n=1 Tax=Thermothielavioides terrestris TaxID=2587410 RepID=A0A3S4AVY7_9PEZI|nr:f3b837d1-9966-45a6-9a97-952ddeb3c61c [Thermothielavioides terrestris]
MAKKDDGLTNKELLTTCLVENLAFLTYLAVNVRVSMNWADTVA